MITPYSPTVTYLYARMREYTQNEGRPKQERRKRHNIAVVLWTMAQIEQEREKAQDG